VLSVSGDRRHEAEVEPLHPSHPTLTWLHPATAGQRECLEQGVSVLTFITPPSREEGPRDSRR
jgi:hypothetical protein